MVTQFVEYFLTDGVPLVAEVGYVPLPDRAYPLALQRVRERRTDVLFTRPSRQRTEDYITGRFG